MSKKGGRLSFEEKCKRMLEIFYEKQDFFQLKDLEKMAPKLKGIVSQTVKEVVQSLVNDNLVICEKIGTSNYFWAFPSAAGHARKRKIEELQGSIDKLNAANETLKMSINEQSSGREAGEERDQCLSALSRESAINTKLKEELEKFKEMDPEAFAKQKIKYKKLGQITNQITDNIYCIQSQCTQRFGFEASSFNKQFNVPEEMDYFAD